MTRYPFDDAGRVGRPGQYLDLRVELAWRAWCAGRAAGPARCGGYRPDHNGECLECDEGPEAHGL